MEVNSTFAILSNPRRRKIVETLNEVGGEASLREIVRRVAIAESEKPDKRLMKSIHTGMLQNHLPKMQEVGVIEYDALSDTLKLTEESKELRYHLEVVDRNDLPWCYYYLILSLFALTTGIYLLLIPGFWLGNLYSALLSVLFFIFATYHTIKTKYNFSITWKKGVESK